MSQNELTLPFFGFELDNDGYQKNWYSEKVNEQISFFNESGFL